METLKLGLIASLDVRCTVTFLMCTFTHIRAIVIL